MYGSDWSTVWLKPSDAIIDVWMFVNMLNRSLYVRTCAHPPPQASATLNLAAKFVQ